ncbi:hypothetical protein GLOIN_2v1845245 [Rhizophagus irregularis DAOM 181602=DAOM 197198]|nr:hypothetical protein GLOIN_2v1845245 [Rhizophagus irregularis DAOM 181602=DAOM 197198]
MLDRLPVEIVERIVAKIPDTDLIAATTLDRVWWQEVRREAYKRWKNYATTIGDVYCEIRALGKHYIKRKIDWITFEDVNNFYKNWIDRLTEDQLYIMEKMLRNGMVVDPQERETIEYALSEQRWGGDPWGLGELPCRVIFFRSGRHYRVIPNYRKRKFMLHKVPNAFLPKSIFCGTGIAQKGNDLRTA